MIEHVDLLVAFRSQPHDLLETGALAARHLFARIKGKIKPTGSRSRETGQDVSNRSDGAGCPVKWACTAR